MLDHDIAQLCIVCCTQHILLCVLGMRILYVPTSNSFYTKVLSDLCWYTVLQQYLPILKHLLIRNLVLTLLCTFQISIQTMAISNLLKVLMILDLKVKVTLLKICVDYRTLLTTSDVIEIFVSSIRYRISKILRYDLD